MKLKKMLSLILAGLLLTGSMVACAKGDDPADGSAESGTQAAGAETEDPAYSLELDPSLSFGNQAVSILSLKNTSFQSEITADKLGNGVVSDSIYERNLSVEELLKIKLNCHESDDVVAVYLLSGPLFFGATQQIDAIEPTAGRHVVLDMTAVSAVDATGLHSLEALRDRCEAVGVELDIRGLSAQPGKTLDHAGFIAHTQARMK